MKIATAAKPERGEGKRGEFYEVIAKANQGAILKLGESAGFAGHEEDFQAARIAGNFIATQRAREILLRLKTGGEDDGVFDGEAGALSEIGADGMGGVTEDGDSADYPGKSGEAILNSCADRAHRGFDELRNRIMPTGKKLAKGVVVGQVWRAQGIVGDGIPVDASGAEAQNAEAAAMAVGFGKITVVLEAEVPSLVFGVDVRHAAPDAVGAIGEFGFEAEGFANSRMNAVACDNEIGFNRASIFKMKEHGAGALFEARKRMV